MTRLIYAEMLKEAWRKKHNIGEDDCGAVFVGYTEIPMLIDEQPTVDAVPVIRCKDCAKREYCRTTNVWATVPDDDWFCADAERRSDGAD